MVLFTRVRRELSAPYVLQLSTCDRRRRYVVPYLQSRAPRGQLSAHIAQRTRRGSWILYIGGLALACWNATHMRCNTIRNASKFVWGHKLCRLDLDIPRDVLPFQPEQAGSEPTLMIGPVPVLNLKFHTRTSGSNVDLILTIKRSFGARSLPRIICYRKSSSRQHACRL